MANHINTATDGKRDKFTSEDTQAAINYISDSTSSTRFRSRSIPHFEDLMISLANAHENRRARQVSEWERLGFQTVLRIYR